MDEAIITPELEAELENFDFETKLIEQLDEILNMLCRLEDALDRLGVEVRHASGDWTD